MFLGVQTRPPFTPMVSIRASLLVVKIDSRKYRQLHFSYFHSGAVVVPVSFFNYSFLGGWSMHKKGSAAGLPRISYISSLSVQYTISNSP